MFESQIGQPFPCIETLLVSRSTLWRRDIVRESHVRTLTADADGEDAYGMRFAFREEESQ